MGIEKSIDVQIDFFPKSHVFKDNLYSLDEIFWDCIFIDNSNEKELEQGLEQDICDDQDKDSTCNTLNNLFKKCETWQARFLEFKAALDKNLDTTSLLKKIFDTPEEFIFNAIGYLLKDAINLKYLAKPNLNNLYGDATSDHYSDSLVGEFTKDSESVLNNNYAQIEKMLLPFEQMSIQITSNIPIGRGYGSSAAVLAALVKAFNNAFELNLSDDEIFIRVYELECFWHGKSSGIDPIMAILGGLQYIQPTNPPKLANATKIKKSKLLNNLTYIDTGKSKSSTGECVSFVANSSDSIDWSEWGECTKNIKKSLDNNDLSELKLYFRKNNELLVKAGVVPAKVRGLIMDYEEKGFAAKVTGSGCVASDSDSCGVVMVVADGV